MTIERDRPDGQPGSGLNFGMSQQPRNEKARTGRAFFARFASDSGAFASSRETEGCESDAEERERGGFRDRKPICGDRKPER